MHHNWNPSCGIKELFRIIEYMWIFFFPDCSSCSTQSNSIIRTRMCDKCRWELRFPRVQERWPLQDELRFVSRWKIIQFAWVSSSDVFRPWRSKYSSKPRDLRWTLLNRSHLQSSSLDSQRRVWSLKSLKFPWQSYFNRENICTFSLKRISSFRHPRRKHSGKTTRDDGYRQFHSNRYFAICFCYSSNGSRNLQGLNESRRRRLISELTFFL